MVIGGCAASKVAANAGEIIDEDRLVDDTSSINLTAGSAHEFMAPILEFRDFLKFGRLPLARLETKTRFLDATLSDRIIVNEFGDVARSIET